MTNILLVDDDLLRAIFTGALLKRKQNAQVHRARGAAEALCLIEQSRLSSKFDLILVMSSPITGEISVPAFVAELQERCPGVPVVVSGSRSDTAEDFHADAVGVTFLPWSTACDELISACGETLHVKHSEVA